MGSVTRGAAGHDAGTDAGTDAGADWYFSRAYEDYLDWLENHRTPPRPPADPLHHGRPFIRFQPFAMLASLYRRTTGRR